MESKKVGWKPVDNKTRVMARGERVPISTGTIKSVLINAKSTCQQWTRKVVELFRITYSHPPLSFRGASIFEEGRWF